MATIVDLRDSNAPLPDFVLLDASVLLRLLGSSPEIVQFLDRIGHAYRQGTTIPLMGILTLEECYHKIIVWAYQTDSSDNLVRARDVIARRSGCAPDQVSWQRLYKERPQFVQRWMGDVDSFFQRVAAIPIHVVEPEDLADRSQKPASLEQLMREMMRRYCLLGKDAYMVAVAKRLGIQHIASLDKDFQRLGPDFTLFTLP